jgi:hypothetical protein
MSIPDTGREELTDMEATARKTGWVTLVGVLFVVGGAWNLLVGLVGVGVSLGGSDQTVLGDLSSGTLEGLGIALMLMGGLQVLTGGGILKRLASARALGLLIAGLVLLIDFAYHRVLEGWALSGMLLNVAIIIILALREAEFE